MPSPETVSSGRSPGVGDDLDALLSLGRGEDLSPGRCPPVHEQVAAHARRAPESIAVECSGERVGYGALDAWAGRIAARLTAIGVGRGDRVALMAEPSAAMVAGVLGILRAGAAYVPIDPAQPKQSTAALLGDARLTAAVVGDGAAADLTADLPVVRLEGHAERETFEALGPKSSVRVSPEDPAYLIYTSGTTGEPKGVLVSHSQLTASTLARRTVYPGESAFLLVSPIAFDSSAAGLWGTLTTGGRLVVARSHEVRDPERLVELVEEHQVTRLLCVPSLYALLLEAAERLGAERLRSLETVIVAGENLPEDVVEHHFTLHATPVDLVNEYGPTEATVWASYQRFREPGPVSVGGPIPGTRLYVLDEQLRPVARRAEGELFIGGAGVACGYFGRPDATARAFVTDPFAGSGTRMYRTGDLVRWNDRGTLDFLGRRDHQVKIRGYRVELGAVEAALRTLPEIRDAVVVADGEQTRLTAFVLASGPASETLRHQLTDRLPPPMVPARIHVLDRFPFTISGKVDRAELGALADKDQPADGPGATAGSADHADDLTGRISAAWADILKTADIAVDVNFFDLGGHSLSVFRLQDALERHTGFRPSVVALFRHTTVSAQAELIRGGGTDPDAAVSPGRDSGTRRVGARRARLLRTTGTEA